jgi:hypothetical protein
VDDDGLGEFVLDGKPNPRAQTLARRLFGALGGALCVVGAVHLWRAGLIPGLPLRVAATAFLMALAAFWIGNVMLARTWKWPLWCVGIGLPLLFIVRLMFGA